MPSQSEIEQTLKMFEHGTKQKWRIIPKSQAKYYPQPGQKNHYWVLCLDTSCKGQIYVVPKGLKPHYSDYDKTLKFLRKKGLPILPKINVNLTDFPAQPYTIDFVKFYIAGTIKPTGSLSLKSTHSKNPMTYTPGKLANIKFSDKTQIDNYVNAWNKVTLIKDSENGEFRLRVGNSITNQYYDFDVSLEGETFSATVSLTPSKMVFDSQWIIEGQISLKIAGTVVDKNSTAASPISPTKKVTAGSINNHGHSVYYYVGIGVSAVGLGVLTVATLGTDLPVLSGLAATTAMVVK